MAVIPTNRTIPPRDLHMEGWTVTVHEAYGSYQYWTIKEVLTYSPAKRYIIFIDDATGKRRAIHGSFILEED